jgi:hypothetical protein
MPTWPETHKPSAAAHVHALAACLMWTSVGALLAVSGARWLWQAPTAASPWLAAGAVGVGVLKSRAVLDRAAMNIVQRIVDRGDGRCIGGFLSLRSWGLVVAMAIAGRFLRGAVGHEVAGPLYIAIGTALVMSSRLLWRAWRRETPHRPFRRR